MRSRGPAPVNLYLRNRGWSCPPAAVCPPAETTGGPVWNSRLPARHRHAEVVAPALTSSRSAQRAAPPPRVPGQTPRAPLPADSDGFPGPWTEGFPCGLCPGHSDLGHLSAMAISVGLESGLPDRQEGCWTQAGQPSLCLGRTLSASGARCWEGPGREVLSARTTILGNGGRVDPPYPLPVRPLGPWVWVCPPPLVGFPVRLPLLFCPRPPSSRLSYGTSQVGVRVLWVWGESKEGERGGKGREVRDGPPTCPTGISGTSPPSPRQRRPSVPCLSSSTGSAFP